MGSLIIVILSTSVLSRLVSAVQIVVVMIVFNRSNFRINEPQHERHFVT